MFSRSSFISVESRLPEARKEFPRESSIKGRNQDDESDSDSGTVGRAKEFQM